MVAVHMPSTLEAELTRIAELSGKSPGYLVTEAVKRYLEDLSDRVELERAIKEFYAGDQKTFSTEEAARELGIAL
jgi:predicted DNA-binding protein